MKTLLLFLSLCLAAPAFAQMPPPPRMITVSGEASEDVAPDRAILSLSLITKNKDLTAAKRANDEMVERLVGITQNFKIAKEKVATSNVNISPEYSYENNKQNFIGYIVSRSLRITIDNLPIHERVLSAIVDAKIDQVNGIEFTLANQEAHAKAVRVKAVENARERAQALATAAGVKLGQVLNIATVTAPMPIPYGRMAMASMEAKSDSVAPSLPGMTTLRELVTVSFALE